MDGANILHRVGVDWNNDGIIEWGVRSTDAPNLLVGGAFAANAVWSLINSSNVPYGEFGIKAVIDDEGGAVDQHISNSLTRTTGTDKIEFPMNQDTLESSAMGQVAISNGVNYTFSLYVKPANLGGTASVTFTLYRRSTSSGSRTSVISSAKTLNLNGQWQRIELTSSFPSTTTYFLNLQIDMTNITTLSMAAPMFQRSSTATAYNTGSNTGMYDDITPYVLDTSCTLGTTDLKERMPSDGTCEILLNNEGRLFSPGNPTGLKQYGVLKPNRKIMIQVLAPTDVYDSTGGSSLPEYGEWKTLWSGFLSDILAGSAVSKEVTLVGTMRVNAISSGKLGYAEGDPAEVPIPEMTSGEVLDMLVTYNQLPVPYGLQAFRLGYSTLGETTILLGTETVIKANSIASESIYEVDDFRYIGVNWEEEEFTAILRALVYSEWGWLFVNRDGRYSFKSRSSYRDGYSYPSMPTINVDTETNDFQFSMGKNIINSVSVPSRYTYRGPVNLLPDLLPDDEEESDDELNPDAYWNRKANIPIGGFRLMRKEIKRVAYREYWRESVSTSIGAPFGDTPISTRDHPTIMKEDSEDGVIFGTYPDPTMKFFDWEPETCSFICFRDSLGGDAFSVDSSGFYQDMLSSIIYDATTPAGVETGLALTLDQRVAKFKKDKFVRLKFRNLTSGVATYTVNPYMIRAVVNLLGEEQTENYTLDESIEYNNATYGYDLEKTLFHNDTRAFQLAQQITIDFGETPTYNVYTGDITSVTFIASEKEEPQFRYPLYMRCGQVVTLKETYIGVNEEKHLVIGEQFQFTAGKMIATISMINVDRFDNAGLV